MFRSAVMRLARAHVGILVLVALAALLRLGRRIGKQAAEAAAGLPVEHDGGGPHSP